MEKDNTKQLQIIAKMLNPDRFITADDISAIRDAVFTLLSNFKKGNEELNAETKKEVEDILKVVEIRQKELYEDIKDGKKEMVVLHKEQVDEIKYLIKEVKKIKPKPGKNGKDANEEKIISKIYGMIEANKTATVQESKQQVTGEQIVDLINDLDYTKENLIDIQRIKGWESFFDTKKSNKAKGFSPTVITNAMDLDSSARADGYAIVWDETNGRFKFASVGSGGSGTGDVEGPASATDNAIARFNGTTGKLIQNSGIIISDADAMSGISTISTSGNVGIGTTPSNARLTVNGGTRSATYYGVTNIYSSGGTFTDTSSSGTVATQMGNFFSLPTFAASSATTYTNVATVYISGAPTAGANVTITNSYSLWVDTGTTRLDGDLNLSSQTASTIAIFDANKNVVSASTSTYPSLTELTYLKGVTSAIQTQIDTKITASSTDTLTNKTINASNNTISNLTLSMFAANVIDVDSALSANSDSRLATQKAVKSYVDASVTGLLDLKGSTDCSTNPNYPSALKGDAYYVTVAGKIGGASGKTVEIGDVYVALADNAGGTEASVGTSWFVLNQNLTGVALTSGTLAQFAATTSSQLAGVISDETGSGALVFATSPTLVTPILGVATATSINNVTITAPASSATLTIANGKTLTANASITLAGTDASVLSLAGNLTTAGAFAITFTSTATTSLTLPTTGTLATLAGAETFTNKTLTAPIIADGGYISDDSSNELLKFSKTASAVNEITIKNSATGNGPQIQATGSDTNIDLNLVPKGTGIVKGELKTFMVRLVEAATDQATGTAVGGDYRISSRAITVKAVRTYCDTAGTTGTYTIDINEAGTTILSTKLTVDSTEKSSETAATPAVISDASIAADAIITFDVDAVQTTKAKGLVVCIDYVYA